MLQRRQHHSIGEQLQHDFQPKAARAAGHLAGQAGSPAATAAPPSSGGTLAAAANGRHGPSTGSSPGRDQEQPEQQVQQVQQVQAPSLADRLLARLLEAEGGGGDPFSIINLYLEDHHRAASAATGTAAPAPAALKPRQAHKQMQRQPQEREQHDKCGGETGIVAVPSQCRPAEQAPAPAPLPAPAAVVMAAPRAISAASDRENVPQHSTIRHQRSNSSILLSLFDAVAEDPPATAPVSHTGRSLLRVPFGRGPPGQQDGLPGPSQPVAQEESSKQLYVKQWLQGASSPQPFSGAASAALPAAADENGSERSGSVASTVQPRQELPAPGKPLARTIGSAAEAKQEGQDGHAASLTASPVSELQLLTSAPLSASTSQLASSASAAAGMAQLPPRPAAPVPDGSTTHSGTASTVGKHEEQLGNSSPGSQQLQLLPMSISELRREMEASSTNSSSSRSSKASRTLASGLAGKEQEVLQPAVNQQLSSCLDMAAADATAEASQRQLVYWHEAELATSLQAAATSSGAIAGDGGGMAEEGGCGLSGSFGSVEISYGAQCGAAETENEEVGAAEAGEAAGAELNAVSLEEAAAACPSDASRPSIPTQRLCLSGGSLGSVEDADTDTAGPIINHRPSSPPVLLRTDSPVLVRARPGSPASPRQRPMSPHAADDKYPSPPRSPRHPLAGAAEGPLTAAPTSRPASPLGNSPGWGAQLPEACRSAEAVAAGGNYTEPAAMALTSPASEPIQQEDTYIARSPTSSATDDLVRDSGGSPYALLEVGCLAGQGDEGSSTVDAQLPQVWVGQQQQQGEADSPPSTPPTITGEQPDESCPGSAVVEDDTVVQTEEHLREYLAAVLSHFFDQRIEGYLRGEEPLALEGFLDLERARPACGDPQHIFNKLLWDATNEALAVHYSKTLSSFAGRLAPERALLDPARLEREVTARVAGWAAMGTRPAFELGTMLAEDAAEEDRVLAGMAEPAAAQQQELEVVAAQELAETATGASGQGSSVAADEAACT